MLQPQLVSIYSGMPKANILQNPSWGIILDAKNRQDFIYEDLTTWARSATCAEASYQKGTTNLNKMVGLNNTVSASTVDLTKTVTLPSSGLYRIEIEVYKSSASSGDISFYDGATLIGDVEKLYHLYSHYERIVYPVRYYTSGAHDFTLTVTKFGMVSNMFIYPIKRYVAGDVDDTDATDVLDVNNIEYTMNATSDMDTCTVEMGLKNEYWNGENESLMEFGFTDSITILMGPNKRELQPVFGGYILGTSPSDDLSSVTLNCINRFLDMKRVPTYHDFYIGTTPTDVSTATQKYMKFSSVYKIAQYLASTLNYPISDAGIPFSYGMNINFGTIEQFNDIKGTNLNKVFDTTFGYPAPSMKLTPGQIAGPFEIVLWTGEQDIKVHNMFNMQYHVSGAGAKYPLEFDLKFTMYRADDNPSDAKDYIVKFTGKTKYANVIGSFTQNIVDTWPSLSFDLGALFDKYANSSEYNLVKISLVGQISYRQTQKPLCSAIWIDQIYTYRSLELAPEYKSSGVKYPFDELQDLCIATDHIAYIKPGLERRNDILVLKPYEIAITDEVLSDDIDGNVLEISSWNDDPISDGYINQANRTFNKAISKTATTPSNTYIENAEAVKINGPFQDHEFWDDISTQIASDRKTQTYVDLHSNVKKGYTITIPASVLIEPNHFIIANIVKGRITSTDQIINITQNLNIEDGIFTCDIDLNRPSLRFVNKIKGTLSKLLRNQDTRNIHSTYRSGINSNIAGTSPGAFSNY